MLQIYIYIIFGGKVSRDAKWVEKRSRSRIPKMQFPKENYFRNEKNIRIKFNNFYNSNIIYMLFYKRRTGSKHLRGGWEGWYQWVPSISATKRRHSNCTLNMFHLKTAWSTGFTKGQPWSKIFIMLTEHATLRQLDITTDWWCILTSKCKNNCLTQTFKPVYNSKI